MKSFTPGRTAIGVSLILFILYLLTLSPTFGFVDKGEMAAVAGTLGIAHPTGYPTIMLLGKLFTVLLPLRDVVALNVMSALLTAAGGGVLVLLFDYLLRMAFAGDLRSTEKRKQGKEKKESKNPSREKSSHDAIAGEHRDGPAPGIRTALAGIGALLTGLTATWWGQGTSFEVYSLHCLMLPLVTLLFLRYVEQEAGRNGESTPWDESAAVNGKIGFTKRGALFALMLGLSFTNHLTTILLAPSLLLWYFWRLGVNEGAAVRLLYLVPFFLLGLAPYLWLPLRASADPFFNWGNPETWFDFQRHVTGAQYRVWMFTNPDTFPQQSAYFFSNLSSETVYIGLLLALLGVVALTAKRLGLLATLMLGLAVCIPYVFFASGGESTDPNPQSADGALLGLIAGYVLIVAGIVVAGVKAAGGQASPRSMIALFIALFFLTCIFYSGGYDILEIGPYYLTALFAVGMWMLFGLVWLFEKHGPNTALGAGAFLAIAFAVANYGMADESNHTLVEDMTLNMLDPLPPDAVIFSKQWDFWVAGSFYIQGVEGTRSDVIVIDYELLRRSWYLDQLQANYPEFMKPVGAEARRLREQLRKFEHDEPYNPNEIEAAYVGMINALVDRGMESRPVFATSDFDEQRMPDGSPVYGGRWGRIPFYLANRLTADTAYLPKDFPEYRFRFADGELTAYTLTLYKFYVQSCLARAAYEQAWGNDGLARRYREYAKTFDPGLTMDDIPVLPLNSKLAAQENIMMFQALRAMDPATGRIPGR